MSDATPQSRNQTNGKSWRGRIIRGLAIFAGVLVLIWLGLYFRYGGGEHSPQGAAMLTEARWSADRLQRVAALPKPPGNIAVARDGQIYFTFHPEGAPEINVAVLAQNAAAISDSELASGTDSAASSPAEFSEYRPYPSLAFQERFVSPLSVRVDRQNRLWVLDLANHAAAQPKIFAFDLASDELILDYEIPGEIAPLGSHMNDFQIDRAGRFMYIADASIFGKAPALIVFDIQQRSARRLLEKHESVLAEHYISQVGGRDMVVLGGAFVIRPHVDSIALDSADEWLYYAAVNASAMYRIRTSDLRNADLSADELAARVERFADKSHSDGITMDSAGNIYLSDPEHDAVNILNARGEFETLLRSPEKLRWPDGFSFGPGGQVYVTCSALHHVIFRSGAHQRASAPYEIYRFPGLAPRAAGH